MFSIKEEQAAELISNITIVHPYGSLGGLQWQSISKKKIPFGAELTATGLLNSLSNISTYSEGAVSDRIETAASHIYFAKKLVFLGFGFNQTNMDLITPDGNLGRRSGRPDIYATIDGISEYEKTPLVRRIRQLYPGIMISNENFVLIPSKVEDFFHQLPFSLSISRS